MDLKKKYSVINKCRISGSSTLVPILELGNQPLANSLKKEKKHLEEKFPLSISYCETSSLLQLNETIEKEELFNEYVWVTSTSETANSYAQKFYQKITADINLEKNDLILEIASNDGTFIKPFIKNGYKKVIGIDPAKNIAELANKNGIKTLGRYWNVETSNIILKKYGEAKLVFARNVIPHVSDLNDVIEGIWNVLSSSGIGIIEFHDAGIIQKELHYDSIYHEHLCYFTIKSISFLLKRFKLYPFNIKRSPISGGSWVIYFSKEKKEKTKNLEKAIIQEEKDNINSLKSWQRFAELSETHKVNTLKVIESVKDKKIVGFGSSARSQTYLNYCGLNSTNISAIADNNPLKQDLYSPGSSISILSAEDAINSEPEIIFILAWNFKDEIIKQCRLLGFKGSFIIPFPGMPKLLD